MNFIRSYLDAFIQNDATALLAPSGSGNDGTGLDQIELARQVMREANYFALASHFMWTVWAINMAVSTTIKFGYMVSNSKNITEQLTVVRLDIFRNMLARVSPSTVSSATCCQMPAVRRMSTCRRNSQKICFARRKIPFDNPTSKTIDQSLSFLCTASHVLPCQFVLI